jgi:sacsin
MTRNIDTKWLLLARDVYEKLVRANACIMIVAKSEPASHISSGEQSRICYYPCADFTPSSQVYFWKARLGDSHKELDRKIRPILERLGMVITSAPLQLMQALNEVHKSSDQEMFATSPRTVYSFYIRNHSQRKFPCAISESSFATIKAFKEFTLYTLCDSSEFVASPFGAPLLLTEDDKLRIFDKDHMVVKSKFASVFPQCQSRFLNSHLLDIKYSRFYFASSLKEQDGLKVVLTILRTQLPPQLFSEIQINNTLVSQEDLKHLWRCLTDSEDEFRFYLHDIIKTCAIIPTTNNQLFSSSCNLQPVAVNPDTHKLHVADIEVLKCLGMPFANTEITCIDIGCPSLSNHERLLKNLYHLFQECDFSSLMNSSRVKTIIGLIKDADFRYHRRELASLPLFETVEGKFTTLYKKEVYKWPTSNAMCDTAYCKWIRYVSATFLNPSAAWTDLAISFEGLGIKSITAEEIYVDNIFPHFSCFSDEERFSHLKHIRDRLYSDNKHFKEIIPRYSLSSRHQIATKFINALLLLECLEDEDEKLKKVSEFCDHEKVIFKAFSQQFQFLPVRYREGEEALQWMKLFKDLGLRQTISKEEYITFCQEVSRGNHCRLSHASKTLVEHLLSEAAMNECWHSDSNFLSRVSKIPFVEVEKMEPLNWIAKQAKAEALLINGNRRVEFTSPAQSALHECSALLWTVKSIVNFHLPVYETSESRAMLEGFKVSKNASANPADIITNVKNICENSKLTDFSLFDTYPEHLKPPDGVTGLMKVMLEIFQHLNSLEYFDVSTISSLPCVPVPSLPQATNKWQLVLVKPRFVVMTCSVDGFHPYLHSLPSDLNSVSPFMVKIGVKSIIDLSHIQAILREAHQQTEGESMEVNTRMCVIEAVKRLKSLLYEKKQKLDAVGDTLSDLYLPSSEGKLCLSTELMYSDTSAYTGSLLHTQHTSYAQLQINSHECNFTASDLCSVIPPSIRPKKMSDLCERRVVSSCEEVPDSRVTLKIKTTLKVRLLSEATLKIFMHYLKDESAEVKLKSFLCEFLSNIKVVTVKNLKTTIILKETGVEIGTSGADFFLKNEENHHSHLYLDSRIEELYDVKIAHEISDYMLSEVRRIHPNTLTEVLNKIRDVLTFLFKIQTDSQIERLLEKEGIAIQSNDMEFPLPELGREIPACWHHRLDQDIDNIFYPTEWVGYEDRENHIIFVQIGYPILPQEHADFETIPRLQMRYMIYTRKDDLNGTDVSTLDLLKFIRGRTKVKVNPNRTEDNSFGALEIFDGDTEECEEFNEEQLESIKEKICQELKEIWKLSEEMRRKALRRLYLKWHPDKNPQNPEFAEQVFKFMLSQIKRLQEGKNIGTDTTTDSSYTYREGANFSWSYDFSSWDYTARDHSRWYKQEQRFYSQGFREHGTNFGTFFSESTFENTQSNVRDGWRWVKQAALDYRMLVLNNKLAQEDNDLKGYGLVCFLSHQVCEKALQGAVNAICGKDERNIPDHNLSRRAYMIQARKIHQTFGLIQHVSDLETYYLDTRYPNRWRNNDIPADQFTAQQANDAVNSAQFVLKMVETLMPPVEEE